MFTCEEYPVRITQIEMAIDRYGRVYPVIYIMPEQECLTEKLLRFNPLKLNSLHDIIRGYEVGARVVLKIIGQSYAYIGPILEHAVLGYEHRQNINFKVCRSCHKELQVRNGNHYCNDNNCPGVSTARLLYAASPRVLDLPIQDMIKSFSEYEIALSLPSVLFMDAEQLMECEFYQSEEDCQRIASVLLQRTNAMFGYYSNMDQHNVQKKILDSLSISNLYVKDQINLMSRLWTPREWDWSDLPEVLTDFHFLRQQGIRKSDALIITTHAYKRIEELSALVRDL